MEEKNRELIRKYIDGTCTESEIQQVKLLLGDPRYQSLFEEVLAERERPLEASHEEADEQMQQWQANILKRIEAGRPAKKQRYFRLSFQRYAAMWLFGLLTLASGYYLLFQKKSPLGAEVFVVQYNETREPLTLFLSDSTEVIVAPGSTVRYPEGFVADSRTVLLDGEAFFDVAKDPARPFRVMTGDIRTEVLGTSFKISSFAGQTEVAVATGKVSVDRITEGKTERVALLTSGETVSYRDGQIEKNTINIAQLERWRDGILVYRQAPLEQITDALERWYGIEVYYDDKNLKEIELDMNIMTDASLESSLRSLTETAGISYRVEGKKVTLY